MSNIFQCDEKMPVPKAEGFTVRPGMDMREIPKEFASLPGLRKTDRDVEHAPNAKSE